MATVTAPVEQRRGSATAVDSVREPVAGLAAASSPPVVSIIVPLIDERDHAHECLERCLTQRDAPAYEVLVVARDGDAEVRALAAMLRPEDRLVPCAGGDEIVYYAAGAAAARGEVLLFTESHCLLAPQAVAAVASRFARLEVGAASLGSTSLRGTLVAELVEAWTGYVRCGALEHLVAVPAARVGPALAGTTPASDVADGALAGFYPAERLPDGVVARWSRPLAALRVGLRDAVRRVELEVDSPLPLGRRALRIGLDGRRARRSGAGDVGGIRRLVVEIPPGLGDDAWLTISCTPLPGAAGPDGRSLGVLLRRVVVAR